MALLYLYTFHDPEGQEAAFYAATKEDAKRMYRDYFHVDEDPVVIRRDRW